MKKKFCILSAVIAGIVLVSAVILFMTKSRYVLADNSDYMENSVTEEAYSSKDLDDATVIINDSSTFESYNNDYMENSVTEEACSSKDLDDATVIINDSSTFESY